jgi:hypothetical protein
VFTTPLDLQADPLPDFWVINAPLIWMDPLYGILTIPKGFRTDLASIPRSFRNIPCLDPAGLSRRPAAAHDWLYAWRGWGKDKADAFLRDALIAEGASRGVAEVFYLGVHEFGQSSWDSDLGALETRDFSPPESFTLWAATELKGPLGAFNHS